MYNEKIDMNKFVAEYGNNLFRICFLYLKDIQLSEDAVKDTFIRIYKNYNKFNKQSSEKTWVTRIAINVCKNYLRTTWFRYVDVEAQLNNIPSSIEIEKNKNMMIF